MSNQSQFCQLRENKLYKTSFRFLKDSTISPALFLYVIMTLLTGKAGQDYRKCLLFSLLERFDLLGNLSSCRLSNSVNKFSSS